MCLDFIDESVKIPKSNIGYKIFLVLDDKLFHSDMYGVKSMPTNVLLHEFNYRPLGFWYSVVRCLNNNKLYCDYTKDRYPLGFHLYVNKSEAINYMRKGYIKSRHIKYKVYKVLFKKVIARGYQDKKQVLVCKYIKILSKIKSK